MRSSTSDIAAGLATLGIAGMFLAQSTELTGVSLLFPKMLIIFMALGGAYLLVTGLLTHRSSAADKVANDKPVAVKRVVLIAVGAVIYAAIIPLLGFYPASTLFLFCMAMALSDVGISTLKNATAAVIFTAVLCAAVWLGFAMILGVPTPQSILF